MKQLRVARHFMYFHPKRPTQRSKSEKQTEAHAQTHICVEGQWIPEQRTTALNAFLPLQSSGVPYLPQKMDTSFRIRDLSVNGTNGIWTEWTGRICYKNFHHSQSSCKRDCNVKSAVVLSFYFH